ncbi:hypothetical protein ACYCFK_09565 [Stutzerimonas stutzeri]
MNAQSQSTIKIEQLPVERDEHGHWTHPAWPDDGDECAIPKGWFADHGLDLCIVEFENDATEDLVDAYFEQGDPDCSKWQPSRPSGDDWFVFSIHDTEDGPICVWVRPESRTADDHAGLPFPTARKEAI